MSTAVAGTDCPRWHIITGLSTLPPWFRSPRRCGIVLVWPKADVFHENSRWTTRFSRRLNRPFICIVMAPTSFDFHPSDLLGVLLGYVQMWVLAATACVGRFFGSEAANPDLSETHNFGCKRLESANCPGRLASCIGSTRSPRFRRVDRRSRCESNSPYPIIENDIYQKAISCFMPLSPLHLSLQRFAGWTRS
jgi:hypothetical protein